MSRPTSCCLPEMPKVLGRKYVGFKDYLSETIRASKGPRSCGNRPGDMHGDVLA
jgi:hypothetical protein